MKIFSLLFLVGCAFASQSEWRWETGKEHVFEYSGRMLTGLPGLASHYSGLGLNSTIIVEVLTTSKLRLRLEKPRFVRVSERLQPRNSMDGPDGANWREVAMPEMREVDQEFIEILKMPIELELVQGEIKQAKIVRSDPEWSVNLKKALALLFQTKMDSSSWQTQDNQVSNSEGLNFWKTKEENIDGVCEVTYQINELPKYMVRDRPEILPFPELCPEQKYFEVTKTKDVNTCEKMVGFSWYKPGRFACTGPNCKDMWARTAETRYIACGSRPGNLMIQSIVNQGELNQNLMGINTERMVTGTLQILRLREVRPIASHQSKPYDFVNVKSMMYEYSSKAYREEQPRISEEEQNLDAPALPRRLIHNPEEVAKTLPRSFLAAFTKPIDQEMPKEKIFSQIRQLFTKVVKETLNPIEEQVEEKQITMKFFSIARGMSILTKSEINEVYKQLKSEMSQHEETFKTLYFDAVLMTGTPEAIYFLKEKFESHEMTNAQAISLFMWMPQSLVLPTEEVLETIMKFVELPRISQNAYLKNIAVMSFTTLLEKSCLSRNRDTTYPTWVWGKFCQPDSPILMEKWVPFLIKELKQRQSWSKKNEIIVALGMLPQKDIIGKLVPYIEGRNPEGSEPVPQMTRLLALWSVATGGELEPQTVEPMVYSIYANPSETTEMRIAAFNVLMKIDPRMATFHKIAARTWTELDREVLAVVNTAIYTLSREEVVEPDEQNRLSLTRKAFLTWPLIKKVKGVLPTSAAIYTTESLRRLGVGYQGLTTWTASNSSFIPKSMYSELNYFLDQYQFSPIQLGLRIEGVEDIYRRFAEIVTPLKSGENAEEQKEKMARKIKESLNVEWRKVIDQLAIQVEAESSPDLDTCSVCKYVIDEVDDLMKGKAASAEEVLKALRRVCNYVPNYFKNSCEKFVGSYSNQIIEYLSDGLEPTEVCQKVRLCRSHMQYQESDVTLLFNHAARENNKISGAVFLRLMETTPMFVNFEHMTTEILREKISPLLKSGSPMYDELRAKMCGQEMPFAYSKAIELAPYEGTIPMDMGLPLNIITRMPVVFSLQGTFKMNCDLTNPGIELKTSVFYNSQFHVQAGTIIPFTKEYAVTAIDETAVINIPARFDLSLNLPKQNLRLAIKLLPHASRPVVDIFHFHVHPYTAHQKVADLTPIVLSNKKLIQSEDHYKKKAYPFGEYLGLDMESEIRTESRYVDLKSAFDKASTFHYNPLNMARFSWCLFALDKNNMPSVRRHEYTLRYRPSSSPTKELIMDLSIGYASKQMENEPMKYHTIVIDQTLAEEEVSREQDPIQKAIKKAFAPLTIKSQSVEHKQMHPMRQQRIAQVISSGLQGIHSGEALVFKYSTTLMGSRPRTWTYYATLTSGKKLESSQRKIESKWNIELESEKSGAKIVVKGQVDIPVLPIWSAEKLRSSLIDFRFFNHIKIVPQTSASPWEINVEGNAKTSHSQKEFSRQSKAAKKCAKKIQEQREQNNSHSKKVELGKLSEACETARREASTLDEVEFSVKYVNVPRTVHWYERVIVEKVKALLWPFLRTDRSLSSLLSEEPSSSIQSHIQNENMVSSGVQSLQSYPVLVRVLFHRETPSFDLVINRANPQEKVVFSMIRLPFPVNMLFPLKAGINNVKNFAQRITGHSLYPVCKIESNTVQTFDNRSMPLNIDHCYHVVASDCSHQKTFAVLARVMKPDNRRQLKVFIGSHKLVLTPSERPSQQSSVTHMKVELNEAEVSIPAGKWTDLLAGAHKVGSVYRSSNNVIQFKGYNAHLELTFNGEEITIETTKFMMNKMCGICGNLNNQVSDEMEGPQKCIFSKPELKVAAYRINDMPSRCDAEKPLPSNIKQRLESEKKECLKQQQIPTKITKSLKTQVGQCTMLKHAVIMRPGQICISKKPVIQCSAGCQAVHNELLKKKVPFTCLAEDRVAEHYMQKATRGERLQELESHPTEFETQVPQPRSCVPATNEL